MATRIAAWLACACWAGTALPARAQTQLDWDAPASYPDAPAVRAGIEHRLGTSTEHAQLAPIRIAAVVTQEPARYRLELTLQTGTGTSHEQLFADDCALFARSIALQVSLSAAPLGAAPAFVWQRKLPARVWSRISSSEKG